MKQVLDPFTDFLNRFAWFFWAILWISLSLGAGQEELAEVHEHVQAHNTKNATIIISILLWSSVAVQTIRQMYYSHLGHKLVKLGRWFILCATSIFAFRMTYMLVVYGGVPSSYATLIGVGLLAIGLSLNSLGMMQQYHFEEAGRRQPKWGPQWHSF